jgi:hypothetical protein
LPPQPAHDPDEPCPFAFASDRGILERAGFVKIEITAHDEQVGSGVLDAMFDIPAIGRLAGSSPPPSMFGDGAVPEAANEREVLAAKTPGIEQGPIACPHQASRTRQEACLPPEHCVACAIFMMRRYLAVTRRKAPSNTPVR